MKPFRALAALAAVALGVTVSPAAPGGAFAQQLNAQEPKAASPAPADTAPADDGDVKQMALTDKQIEGLLAAQQDVEAITSKTPDDSPPDAKVLAELDAVVKKHGFASYAEYGNVAANVDMLLDGFDPKTKKFVGFEAVIKNQIARIQADSKIPADDRKEALDELNAALSKIPTVEYPGNIELVAKYYDKLNDVLRAQE